MFKVQLSIVKPMTEMIYKISVCFFLKRASGAHSVMALTNQTARQGDEYTYVPVSRFHPPCRVGPLCSFWCRGKRAAAPSPSASASELRQCSHTRTQPRYPPSANKVAKL